MRKQYIDFVPTNRAKSAKSSRTHVEKKVSVVKELPARPVRKATRISSTSSLTSFGVVEDLYPKNTSTSRVETAHFVTEQSSLRAAKAQKVGNRASVKPVERSVEKIEEKPKDKGTYKTPFINQDKVKKRPLSKNVYRKRPSVAKTEAKQGPVTIISKPEKDAKIGLIVTIILTIILGAAAGTIAFLLLPK